MVLLGVLFNNKRLDDMRDLLRAEMAKNQSELLVKFSEIDSRLARLKPQRIFE